jgi:hypothetical protein
LNCCLRLCQCKAFCGSCYVKEAEMSRGLPMFLYFAESPPRGLAIPRLRSINIRTCVRRRVAVRGIPCHRDLLSASRFLLSCFFTSLGPVDITAGQRAERPRNRDSIFGTGRRTSFRDIQRLISPTVQWQLRLIPGRFGSDVKLHLLRKRSCTSTPPYAFMVWLFIT